MNSPPVFQSPYPRPNLLPPPGPTCPRCGSGGCVKIRNTYWGGVVAPALFNLFRCSNCRCQFNGKTGKSALKAIIIYNLVSLILAILIVTVFRSSFHWRY